MSQIQHPASFTIEYNGIVNEIITEIGVSEPISEVVKLDDKRIHRTTALWDTGATNSVITPKIAKALNLRPISVTKVNHAGGSSNANVYLVNIFLPNNISFTLRVSECSEQAGNFGLIIGMDIIRSGDFAFSNVGGKSVVSFRVPSTHKIDFVNNKNTNYNTSTIIKDKKNMPNEPCPCGSGIKYKKCHGKGL